MAITYNIIKDIIKLKPDGQNLNFHRVQMEHIYQNCWIIEAKVMWKAHIKENGMGNLYLQCILLDRHGTKMEAIAYNSQAIRFNSMLQIGRTYDFSRVGFSPTEMPDGHFWYLAMDFVTTLSSTTEVWMSAQQIPSTICPPCFPQFGEIFELRDKTITDVVAILAYVGQIE
ncbi:hypothetical protein VPH35_037589 [Triticum aestivum]|uniref:Replication protein A 70 kDa DNA-binding subunit B/D first OB fold domain-containing protein n=1 Tax=Aegilops tauschii TaxID=37682 RepID=M8C670_AEGTA